MKTIPMPVRLDEDLQILLRDGARRTPHKKQELIRMTLRLHLGKVIESEVRSNPARRITNIEPLPARVLRQAYRRIGKDWDKLEKVATIAQGKPDFND